MTDTPDPRARSPHPRATVPPNLNARPPRPAWPRRIVFVACGLAAWFWTQSLIGHREPPTGGVGDVLHEWTAPAHDYLVGHPRQENLVLIVSSAVIDLMGVFLLARAIFGSSVRPFLGLFMLFLLRQVCQGLCSLPPPQGMIWHSTGVPTLLVTYGVATDLFFSGHTGLAVLGATELARLGHRWLTILGVMIAVGEAAAVLILRAHYTMDVFTGAVTALYVGGLAATVAPAIDGWLARLGGRGTTAVD